MTEDLLMRGTHRKQCAHVQYAGTDRTRARERKSIFQTVIVPADGTITAAVRERRLRYIAVFRAALDEP